MLEWFADRKDGLITLFATVFFIVGGYQYLEYKMQSKIEKSLKIAERREDKIFVEAREYTIRKWIEIKENNQTLGEQFAASDVYTDEMYKLIGDDIASDEDYKQGVLHLGILYHNAAACSLDSHCDKITLCSSLMGEIQDFLDINRPYFAYAVKFRKEDAVSLFLDLPEFVEMCESKLFVRALSRKNSSLACKANVFSERMVGLSYAGFCAPSATDYHNQLTADAEKI